MNIVKVKSLDKIDLTPAEWNSMLENNETNTIFQTFQWFSAWCNSYLPEDCLYLLIIRDGRKLVGIAPFYIQNINNKRILRFVSDSHADYLDFIIPENKKETLSFVLEYIYNNESDWDKLDLINLPEQSSSINILAEWHSKHNRYYFVDDNFLCPAIVIDDKEAITSCVNRYNIKRSYNYFNRGKLEFSVLERRDQKLSCLPIFFKQHIERWSNTKTKSLFNDAANQNFYRLLTQSFQDEIHFSLVKYNDEILAFHFGFIYDEKLIWYKPTYNIQFSSHSPGIVLIRFLILHALDENLKELDFTVGNEKFKQRFANTIRRNINFTTYHKKYRIKLYILKKLIISFLKYIRVKFSR